MKSYNSQNGDYYEMNDVTFIIAISILCITYVSMNYFSKSMPTPIMG